MKNPITIETILGVSVDIAKIMKFCNIKPSELPTKDEKLQEKNDKYKNR